MISTILHDTNDCTLLSVTSRLQHYNYIEHSRPMFAIGHEQMRQNGLWIFRGTWNIFSPVKLISTWSGGDCLSVSTRHCCVIQSFLLLFFFCVLFSFAYYSFLSSYSSFRSAFLAYWKHCLCLRLSSIPSTVTRLDSVAKMRPFLCPFRCGSVFHLGFQEVSIDPKTDAITVNVSASAMWKTALQATLIPSVTPVLLNACLSKLEASW